MEKLSEFAVKDGVVASRTWEAATVAICTIDDVVDHVFAILFTVFGTFSRLIQRARATFADTRGVARYSLLQHRVQRALDGLVQERQDGEAFDSKQTFVRHWKHGVNLSGAQPKLFEFSSFQHRVLVSRLVKAGNVTMGY